MDRFSNRKKLSRGRFLLGAGSAAGALFSGGIAAPRAAGAREPANPAPTYDGYAKNTTGTFVPEGKRYLVTSDKPEEIKWGYLPNRDAEPVLTVRSGDVVSIEQISHEGISDDQGGPVKFFASRGVAREEILDDQIMVYEEVEHKGEGPHVVTGPVAVEGAEPGDWLEVRCMEIEPRVAYGVASIRNGAGPFPDEFPTGSEEYRSHVVRFDMARRVGLFPAGSGIEVPLRPFMGLFGVAPDTSALVSSTPPDVYGGNLDATPLMTAGSTVYYPVQVPGALFYTSDGHAAQGNGEVSIAAVETSQTPTFQVILHKKENLREEGIPFMNNPWGETEEAYVVTGMDENLDEAAKEAIRETVSFLVQTQGLSPDDAYVLAGVAVDFEISQIVDQNRGVHAMIPKRLFANERLHPDV